MSTDTLLSLLEARAASGLALAGEGLDLHWEGLEARSNQLAWQLIERGAGPEGVVALALPRSAAFVEAMLAVLKSGAAFLPIDIAAPKARQAALIAQAGARAALTLTAHAGDIGDIEAVVLDDRATQANLAARNSKPPNDAERRVPLRGAHPAYVLFTSGSTGQPKGVAIPHAAIAAYVVTLSDLLGDSARRMPFFTGPGFDLTLTSLLVPLIAGGVVEIHKEAAPEAALARIFAPDAKNRAVKLTPAHIALLETLPFAQNHTLEIAVVGGEALTAAHVRTLLARAPQIKILNEYGPTEATIGAVAGFVSRADQDIGRPYPGVEAHVLDNRLRPCPQGVVGELYLGGTGLARGYWQAPARTAERFIADPFRTDGRLYRTGDRAMVRPSGALAYHGRSDDQIKRRGLRIEPGEIEAALAAIDGLVQAAVIACADAHGQIRLIAYVTAAANKFLDAENVREALSRTLPSAMLPDTIIVRPTLPLTQNGKIDRTALSAAAPREASDAAPYAPPQTDNERLLCSVIAELLEREKVGRDDNFFKLGGHSLLAARLAARIRQKNGAAIGVQEILSAPNIRDMALHVGETDKTNPAFTTLLPMRSAGAQPPLFCLHPVGGLCWPYFSLLPFTSEDQPIYGLQAQGFLPETQLAGSMSEVVAACADAVMETSPRGAVRLLGWSFGGVLAHMLATHLQGRGRHIDKLILLDAYPPLTTASGVYPPDPRVDGVWRDLAFGLDLDVPNSIAAGSLDGDTVMRLAEEQSHTLAVLSRGELERFAEMMANNTSFMASIRLSVFQGDLDFVAGDVRPPGFDRERMNSQAWAPFCSGSIRATVVHSTHNRMLSIETLRQAPFLGRADLSVR